MAHWDIGALRAAQDEVRALAGVTAQIAREVRPELERFAFGAIGGRITSYGVPWAPLKSGGEASTTIADRMKVVDVGSKIRVRLDRVASYHDRGTRKMVARPIIPTDAQGIPQPWRTEITKTAAKIMAETVHDH
jgi:hypothetical protein